MKLFGGSKEDSSREGDGEAEDKNDTDELHSQEEQNVEDISNKNKRLPPLGEPGPGPGPGRQEYSPSDNNDGKDITSDESREDTGLELDSLVCQHQTLSSPSSLKWVCDERGPQEFGNSCFLQCQDDNKVPDSPIVSVCTPEGWIPHPQKLKDYPRCVPAPCENLHNESLDHGI